MTRAANDNASARPYVTQLRPRNESAPGVDTIGLDVCTPLDALRLRDAAVTLEDGLSVLVRAEDWRDASFWAVEIMKAAETGARR